MIGEQSPKSRLVSDRPPPPHPQDPPPQPQQLRAAKELGFSDQSIDALIGAERGTIRALRKQHDIRPHLAQIDTMAKERFAQLTTHPVVKPTLAPIIEIDHSDDPSAQTDDEIRSVF